MALIAAGAIVGIGALGTGAVFAWQAFHSSGPQPAEALPGNTLGYVSIDLDPSGAQKVEALKTLHKFPAFAEKVGVDSGDDLREKIFDAVQGDAGVCPDISFDTDIKPWLGDRFALAAVPLSDGSSDQTSEGSDVTPVGVVQITDADAAEKGLEKLRDCASGTSSDSGSDSGTDDPSTDSGSGSDEGGWSISGDWVVLAPTADEAKQVTDAAAQGTLADDADYQKWTGAAGDAGILTGYAAPDAGKYLARGFDYFGSLTGHFTCTSSSSSSDPYDTPSTDPFSEDTSGTCGEFEQQFQEQQQSQEQELSKLFENFGGAAVTVRFDGGGLEVETATANNLSPLTDVATSDTGGDMVETLPADTAVAIGVGFQPGWFTQATDYINQVSGGQVDISSILDQAEQSTGLSFPQDAETLAGSSTALSLGSNFDPSVFDNDTPDGVPIAIKVQGDTDAIAGVLEKIKSNPDLPSDVAPYLETSVNGDTTTVAFDSDYRNQVSGDGDLGDDDTFSDVVEDADDAGQVVYVNFDANDWLSTLVQHEMGDDPDAQQVLDNLAPLKALGYSSTTDGDVTHGVLRVTTD